MNWIILAVIAVLIASISAFLDNYTCDVIFKKRYPQAEKILASIFYILTACLIPIFFPLQNLPIFTIVLIVISGILGAVASLPYYSALKTEETTNMVIFSQLKSVVCLVLAFAFFGEKITGLHLLGFIVTFSAPFVIYIFESKQGRKTERKTLALLSLYVLISSVGSVVFAHSGADTDSSFFTVFFYYVLSRGLTDLVLIIKNKKWRTHFRKCLKKQKANMLLPMILNEVIYVVYEVCYRATLLLAPVALVTVTISSLELGATFILGIILSLIWPNFGREKVDKKSVASHLIATILAIVGVFLMQ